MTLRASDWRAIKNYAETHSLRPCLSIPTMGQFYFLDAKGKEVSVGLQAMIHEYQEQKKRDKQS